MKAILYISFFLLFTNPVFAQILNGPMIGHVAHCEVKLWVQTKQSQTVAFAYRKASTKEQWSYTQQVVTKQNEAFICELTLDNLNPGQTYEYRVAIDNELQVAIGKQQFTTPILWAYRSTVPDFSFAIGSCTYINEADADRKGKPYGEAYQIFESIAQKQPNLMLWLGDNVYFREPDWTSKSGMLHRYTHSRNIPELRQLLANTPQYAIWDDHDFGPNDSDGSFVNKGMSKEVFDLFWANPDQNHSDIKGISNQFEWADCHFFLLDNRFERAPNQRKDGYRTILGKSQLEWLKDALVSSKASFKFIALGGQFLNTAPVFENYNANGFDKERQELIDFIYLHQIKNVVFLTGDRHHSEMSVLKQEGMPTIYDLTISPLTSGVHDASKEANTLRVEGSHLAVRNFGLLKVEGDLKTRVLSIEIKDAGGLPLWQTKIEKEH
jgi:alkaline phosphatase D